MPDHVCSSTISALLGHLENGTPLTPGVEDELRACNSCSDLVRRAQRLGSLLDNAEPVADARIDTLAVESEVTRRHRRRLYWSAFAVLVASVALGLFVATRGQLHHPVAVAVIVAVFFGGPVLLVIASIRSMSPGKIYKRLEGRQVSGVCRGLAEAWGAPVWVIRMAFVALLFGKGIGLLLYLVLDVVLPIHPADRAGLLRFRIARWWRARFA